MRGHSAVARQRRRRASSRFVVAGAIDYSSFGTGVPAQQSESATSPIRYGHPLRTIVSFDADRLSFELT